MNTRCMVFAVALAMNAASVSACPVCNSATGNDVRAGIFGDDFGRNLLAVVLPFVAVAGVAAVVHFGLPARGRGDGHQADEP